MVVVTVCESIVLFEIVVLPLRFMHLINARWSWRQILQNEDVGASPVCFPISVTTCKHTARTGWECNWDWGKFCVRSKRIFYNSEFSVLHRVNNQFWIPKLRVILMFVNICIDARGYGTREHRVGGFKSTSFLGLELGPEQGPEAIEVGWLHNSRTRIRIANTNSSRVTLSLGLELVLFEFKISA